MIEKRQSEYNIPLGKGKYAQIDLCDLDKVVDITFSYHKCPGQATTAYAVGCEKVGEKWTWPTLHRLIMGDPPSPDLEIGHKDGNGLNCHKSNLRWVTHQQNMQGKRSKPSGKSSQYRGVCYYRRDQNWQASIYLGSKRHLGYFEHEEDAARAYDAAAIKYFGEHAACNFPR